MRNLWVSFRVFLVFTVILGVLYPLLVFGAGQVFFKQQAQGSLLYVQGEAVGSSLLVSPGSLGDRRWFQARFSAVKNSDMSNSGGTNLLFASDVLRMELDKRLADIASFENVSKSLVPFNAVTSSASGWENLVSLDYALLQVKRVAQTNNLPTETVQSLVHDNIVNFFLNNDFVNVSKLNVALLKILSK